MRSIFQLNIIFSFSFLLFLSACHPTTKEVSAPLFLTESLIKEIDFLAQSKTPHAFNGVILIAQNDRILYQKTIGYADVETKEPLTLDHQFVIGSISKQITAVLILQAYEKGLLDLEQPISVYLPNLPLSWKDSVHVHHLLTHQHGIQSLDKALNFSPNSQFQYSQLGYELLAQILEQVHQKSFVDLSSALFEQQTLTNTFHPERKDYKNLVKGYTENDKGALLYELNSFKNYVPAGCFISTVQDLTRWNVLLHSGQLLKPETFQLMQTKYATREHPIFEAIDYGYGLTFKAKEQAIQIGALGFAPGFVSSSFYFPPSEISLVILENVAANLNDFKQTFYYHTSMINLIRTAVKPHKK